jgi:signal transduction histidine kinase
MKKQYRKIFSLPRKSNIQVKITVLFFLLLMGFSYIIGIYLTYQVEEKAFSIAEQYVKGMPKLIKNTIGEHMMQGNRDSIKEMIAEIVDEQVVLGVHIFDKEGNLSCGCMADEKKHKDFCRERDLNYSPEYLSAIRKNFKLEQYIKKVSLTDKKFISFYTPYINKPKCQSCHVDDGKIIGVLNVNIDVTKFMGFFEKKVRLVKIIMIIFSIFMAIILSILVNYLIINPIRKLEKGMKAVAVGDYTKKVEINSNDELERLSKYFNHMVYSLKQANNQIDKMHGNLIHTDRLITIGQLMASISHEIKNPLNSIMLTADILQMKYNDKIAQDELFKYLDNIIQDSEKIINIIDQTLSFSKVAKFQSETICADEFMEILEIYANRIIFSNSDVSFYVQKLDNFCKYKIKFNRISLEQVFINLLKNAVEAIEEGKKGFISIHVEYKDNYLYFYIQDNGKGIKEEQLKYIFKEFFTTKTEGTGLGLSIVKNLLEEFDGSISVESKENKGTVFTIKLPVEICPESENNT